MANIRTRIDSQNYADWQTNNQSEASAFGRSFGTANGNLSFDSCGELISRLWNESHSQYPMYRAGSADMDDTERLSIVWKLGGRKAGSRTPLKPRRNIENFESESGDIHSVGMMEFTNSLMIEIRADDSTVASQIALTFEKFMFEFIGALKAMGVAEIIYASRLADSIEEKAGRSQTKVTIIYTVIDQMLFIVKKSAIAQVELALNTITD